MGGADRIAGQPVGLEVGGALMEFPAVLEADAVHHQVTVQMVGVDVGGHQHLEVRKLPLGQLQSDGMGLLGCQAVLLAEGLDEVIVLPSVRFPVPLRWVSPGARSGRGIPIGGAECVAPQVLADRVDSADFVGGLIIGTIGTLEVDDPLPVAAANGGCDARFP